MSTYKLSKYLNIVPYKKSNILASGLTGAIIQTDLTLKDLKHTKPHNKEMAKLREEGFLVKKDLDETKIAREIFTHHEKQYPLFAHPSFVLTYKCNFACTYCFEKEKNVSMTKEIADNALNQIFATATKRNYDEISGAFFGGEPLLEFQLMKYIVGRMEKFSAERKIDCSFSMITNGSLFTKTVSDFFNDKNLSYVQFTIDGPKETHNKRRFYKKGLGSFDKIIENIPNAMACSDLVGIRVNVDSENLSEVPALIEELKPFANRNAILDFGHVTNIMGRGEGRENKLSVKDFSENLVRLLRLARKGGFQSPKVFHLQFKCVRCPATAAAPTWIDPYGDLYCCEHAIGDKKYAIGNLQTGVNKEKAEEWRKFNLLTNEHCLNCKTLFFCGGLCPFERMKGLKDDINCYAFNNLLKDYLEARYYDL